MIKQVYLLGFGFFILSGFGFWFVQNDHLTTQGGGIAPVKAAWLMTCIFYWIFLPALLSKDQLVSPSLRMCYGVFLGNMLLRAVVELYLMYVTQSWHP